MLPIDWKTQLKNLDPDMATKYFRELLYAEARKIGLPERNVRVPGNIFASDGGIDATALSFQIDDSLYDSSNGLIRKGKTTYQIKAGDSDERLLVQRKQTNRPYVNLPKVTNCLDEGGTFIAIMFDWANPDKSKLISKMKKWLGEDYKDANIDIIAAEELAIMFESHPSCSIRINRLHNSNAITFNEWEKQPQMQLSLKESALQKAIIQNIVTAISKGKFVQLGGEPGRGKTRIVLEAVRGNTFASSVLYYNEAKRFISDVIYKRIGDFPNWSFIAVVDECEYEDWLQIKEKFSPFVDRCIIITIDKQTESYTIYPDVERYIAPAVEDLTIKSILHENYGIDQHFAKRWAGMFQGYPRFAHLIGPSLSTADPNLLRLEGLDFACKLIIAGKDNFNSTIVERRMLVMNSLALFSKCGITNSYLNEIEFLHRQVEKIDDSFTIENFRTIIAELKEMKVIQGNNTVYITPKILHIWLWNSYWRKHADFFDYEEFVKNIPKSLLKWFHEMFEYMVESDETRKTCERLLGPDGPFPNGDAFFDKIKTRFFFSLTNAYPDLALKCIQRNLNNMTTEDLLKIDETRWFLVSSLERMAMHKDIFVDAARILLSLAEAENQNYSNNAEGTFIKLFNISSHPEFSSTEADPFKRIIVLEEAITSGNNKRIQLAIDALCIAFSSGIQTRMIGPEYQGLKKILGWKPATWKEFWDAKIKYWKLLSSSLSDFPEEVLEYALERILETTRGLAQKNHPDLTSRFIQFIKTYIKPRKRFRREAIKDIAVIHRYDIDRLSDENREAWLNIYTELVDGSFELRFDRYVGTMVYDLEYDEEGQKIDASKQKRKMLAEEVIKTPSLLDNYYTKLSDHETQVAGEFCYFLGNLDTNNVFFEKILGGLRLAGEQAQPTGLAGYILAIKERDEQQWKLMVKQISEDEKATKWIPFILNYCGLNEWSAGLALELYKQRKVNAKDFNSFAFGGSFRSISTDLIYDWINAFIQDGSQKAIELALVFYAHGIMLDKNNLKEHRQDTCLNLLLSKCLFESVKPQDFDSMTGHYWGVCAKRHMDIFPSDIIQIGDRIVDTIENDGLVRTDYNREPSIILESYLTSHTLEAWEKISSRLGPPFTEASYPLSKWLQGEKDFSNESKTSPLNNIEKDIIFDWIDADKENRAWFFATFVPKDLTPNIEESSWVRELLIKYGDDEKVGSNLSANYFSEGYTGPSSIHYREKKKYFVEIKKSETHKNVITWLDSEIDNLTRMIERAEDSEERDDIFI